MESRLAAGGATQYGRPDLASTTACYPGSHCARRSDQESSAASAADHEACRAGWYITQPCEKHVRYRAKHGTRASVSSTSAARCCTKDFRATTSATITKIETFSRTFTCGSHLYERSYFLATREPMDAASTGTRTTAKPLLKDQTLNAPLSIQCFA